MPNDYVGRIVTGRYRGSTARVRVVSYHVVAGAAARVFTKAKPCYFCHLLNKDNEIIAVGYVPAALVEREKAVVLVDAA
jgi:hypothetical protein